MYIIFYGRIVSVIIEADLGLTVRFRCERGEAQLNSNFLINNYGNDT